VAEGVEGDVGWEEAWEEAALMLLVPGGGREGLWVWLALKQAVLDEDE
jgi:hypothetical protein